MPCQHASGRALPKLLHLVSDPARIAEWITMPIAEQAMCQSPEQASNLCSLRRPLMDLRVSVTGGVHFDLVKRVLRDIKRSGQAPEEIIQQVHLFPVLMLHALRAASAAPQGSRGASCIAVPGLRRVATVISLMSR